MKPSAITSAEVRRLCIHYQTDTLREAIAACEEELEWLRELADRYEPEEPSPAEGSAFASPAELEEDRDAICRSAGLSRFA
ncbi:MAG: hypothetical protein LUF04_13360 [Bacteroides sp.]|nr:hypothetical protein [Bacteroides sp.]